MAEIEDEEQKKQVASATQSVIDKGKKIKEKEQSVEKFFKVIKVIFSKKVLLTIAIVLLLIIVTLIMVGAISNYLDNDTENTSTRALNDAFGGSVFGGGTSVVQNDSSGRTTINNGKKIFIGDSRTVGMHNTIYGGNQQSIDTSESDETVWSAKVGMGLDWMKETGVPNIEDEITAGVNVIIMMGGNDIAGLEPEEVYTDGSNEGIANKYINYINEKANEWSRMGANIYYVSINPFDEAVASDNGYSLKNSTAEAFNAKLAAGLSNVTYIDTYTQIGTSFSATDGVHYDADTYRRLYSLIRQAVEGSGGASDTSSGSTGGGTTGTISTALSTESILKIEGNKFKISYVDSEGTEYTGKSAIEQKLKEVNFNFEDYSRREIDCIYSALKAQWATSVPNLGGEVDNTDVESNYLQGVLTVKRETMGGAPTDLEFIELEAFNAMVLSGDTDILNHFSINGNNLVIAYENYGVINTKNIDYKNMIGIHALPYEFTIPLLVNTEDVDFVNDIINTALESEIELTIYENTVVTTTNIVTIHHWIEIITYEIDEETGEERTVEIPRESRNETENTVTTKSISYGITHADSWIGEVDNSFTYRESTDVEGPIETENRFSTTEYEEIYSTITTHRYLYTQGTAEVNTESIGRKFKEAYDSNSLARGNLLNVYEWLIEMLEDSEITVNYVPLMKYLLFLCTGRDFGVSVEDIQNLLSLYGSRVGGSSGFSSFNSPGSYGNSTEERVWFALKSYGFSDYAVAGAMGNIMIEGQFRANNLENSYEEILGYTDETYTAAVDDGSYSRQRFISDHREENCGAGYGLVQWTWYTRKGGLYDYVKSKGVSIGDETAQIEYLIAEICGEGPASSFATRSVSDRWKNAGSIEEATRIFCDEFERPSYAAYDLRIDYARQYYNTYQGRSAPASTEGWTPSSNNLIHGSFTTNGKTFYMLNQAAVGDAIDSGWYGYCNRATAICLASGLAPLNEQGVINAIHDNFGSYCMSSSGTYTFFGNYGISADIDNISGGDYRPSLRACLTSGKYAGIWIDVEDYGRVGSVEWTSLYHWVAVLAYDSAQDKIFIADPSSRNNTGWFSINEFMKSNGTSSNIGYVTSVWK